MIRLLYTILFFIFTLLMAPLWLWKMKKRGGWGTGLRERLGLINKQDFTDVVGADYYHAVSVGEVKMAVKVIEECLQEDENYRAVIAVTTSTGRETAFLNCPKNTEIIYAPIDLPPVIKKVFSFLQPRQLILVDSELWVNLQHYAEREKIPVRVINGRLSERSFLRYQKFPAVVNPMLKPIVSVCVDGEIQVSRWQALGIPEDQIYDVGSLKFDFSETEITTPEEFKDMLDSIGSEAPVVMLASTHPGEEKLLAQSLRELNLPHRLAVVPRHMERREEVIRDLKSVGYNAVLRSDFKKPLLDRLSPTVLVIDSTGELASWLALADVVIIGKSWVKKGGQNPFESVIAGIPTICGPYMDNFQPLLNELLSVEGALQLSQADQLAQAVKGLLENPERAERLSEKGRFFLQGKTGATERTARVILS